MMDPFVGLSFVRCFERSDLSGTERTTRNLLREGWMSQLTLEVECRTTFCMQLDS